MSQTDVSEMNDQHYRAMCQAVCLGYQIADLQWTKAQRAWLDDLCAEAQGTFGGCGILSADQTRHLS